MQNLQKFLIYNKSKLIISVFMVVLALVFPKVGFLPVGSEGFCLYNNLIFPVFHANIFHVLCNVFCIWCMSAPYYTKEGVAISFICSVLPECCSEPIMGFSGVLFAIMGIKYGVANMFSRMVRKTWIFFLVTAFIPNVACLFHIYCITLGFIYGHLITDYKLWKSTGKIGRD